MAPLSEQQPTEYDDRFVAFLDILGFANHVEASLLPGRTELHRLMWNAGIVEEVGGDERLEYTIFSDSILISSITLRELLNQVSRMWKLYAGDGFFLRGGVAYGKTIHQGHVAYGPAITSAFRLESEVAHVPRVVIDPKIEPHISRHLDPRIVDRIVKRDSDGIAYLETFAMFATVEPRSPRPWLISARAHIESGLHDHEAQPGVLAKFRWLARLFNEYVNAQPKPYLLQEIPSR